LPDLPYNAFDLFQCARAGIEVGGPQTHSQQMLSAHNVERQVTVVVIEAVKKALLLMAMQRQIGRIHIDHNLGRCFAVRFQEDLHQ
jgi:hypothetical protein